MEKGEPSLVPEWLKGSNGSIASGGALQHSPVFSPTDDHQTSVPAKIKLSISTGDPDCVRSLGSQDKPLTPHYRRSSSSNGSIVHDKDRASYTRSYNSFSRSHRDKDREKIDKEWLLLDDSGSFGLLGKSDKDVLRRSRSMISGKKNEMWPKKIGVDASNGSSFGRSSNTAATQISRTAFDRDFPSLGTEEKAVASEIAKTSVQGLSSMSQTFSICSSTIIGGEGWTSALAEVPIMIGGSGSGPSSVPLTATSASTVSQASTSSGLNMAETLAQTPSRTRATPQLSVETHRLEELAIRQSKQLIPMTPSMPKTSVHSSSDKLKSKPRASETLMANKSAQCATIHVNNSHRGSSKCDGNSFSNSTSGKLLVLKCQEKNGVSLVAPPAAKDSANFAVSAKNSVASPTTSVANGASMSPKNVKAKTPSKTQGLSIFEKKLPSSVQGRNDFFNSLRKKATPSSGNISIPENSDKLEQQELETSFHNQAKDGVTTDPLLDWSLTQNGGSCHTNEDLILNDDLRNVGLDEVVDPDEEEARFLKSLGWEENAGEEEALTEEEIRAFYEEYMKLKPTAKLCRGLQQVNALACGSDKVNGFSSLMGSSD